MVGCSREPGSTWLKIGSWFNSGESLGLTRFLSVSVYCCTVQASRKTYTHRMLRLQKSEMHIRYRTLNGQTLVKLPMYASACDDNDNPLDSDGFLGKTRVRHRRSCGSGARSAGLRYFLRETMGPWAMCQHPLMVSYDCKSL